MGKGKVNGWREIKDLQRNLGEIAKILHILHLKLELENQKRGGEA